MIWKRKNIVDSQAENACSKVPWSKGQDTGLSSRRYWVQGLRSASVGAKRGPLDHSTPWGSLWLLSLKVRTLASQAGNDGFKPHLPQFAETLEMLEIVLEASVFRGFVINRCMRQKHANICRIGKSITRYITQYHAPFSENDH